jgi:hypothetical protein
MVFTKFSRFEGYSVGIILRQVNTHVDDATVLVGEHVEAPVLVQIEAASFRRCKLLILRPAARPLQAVDFASGGTVEKRFLASPSWVLTRPR